MEPGSNERKEPSEGSKGQIERFFRTVCNKFTRWMKSYTGRLIASLSRTKVYKDRVKQDMRRKADIAFREMESEMLKVIKQDEKSAAQLKEILAKAKERMMEDD